jgi:hypothetical protein
MDKQIETEPSDVTARDGVVNVLGPDGVDVAMTPQAAEETSHRLLEGAAQAFGQDHVEDMKRDEEERRRRF